MSGCRIVAVPSKARASLQAFEGVRLRHAPVAEPRGLVVVERQADPQLDLLQGLREPEVRGSVEDGVAAEDDERLDLAVRHLARQLGEGRRLGRGRAAPAARRSGRSFPCSRARRSWRGRGRARTEAANRRPRPGSRRRGPSGRPRRPRRRDRLRPPGRIRPRRRPRRTSRKPRGPRGDSGAPVVRARSRQRRAWIRRRTGCSWTRPLAPAPRHEIVHAPRHRRGPRRGSPPRARGRRPPCRRGRPAAASSPKASLVPSKTFSQPAGSQAIHFASGSSARTAAICALQRRRADGRRQEAQARAAARPLLLEDELHRGEQGAPGLICPRSVSVCERSGSYMPRM